MPGGQSIQSPTLRVVQPSPGLEGFAANLQQGIDGYYTSVRQRETERQKAEAARVAIAVAEQAREAQRQREIEALARTNREVAVAVAARILQDFQIEERLRIIQQTVWERKGRIWPIEPNLDYGILGGLELVHKYPSFDRETEGDLCRGRWRYIPATGSTVLSVQVKNREIFASQGTGLVTEEQGMFLRIESLTLGPMPHHYYGDTRGAFRIGVANSRILLETLLFKDSDNRIANQGLPSQIEEKSRKARPPLLLLYWPQWTTYYNSDYDPSS